MPDRRPHRMSEYMPDRFLECMPDRMPDRMTTASVLEYMSERVPEAKVVWNRLSGDCWKQSHAINVKLKCEGLKYSVRIETWPDSSWFRECMADSTNQLKQKQRISGTDPMMQHACMILTLAVCIGYHLFAFVVQYSTCMTAVTACWSFISMMSLHDLHDGLPWWGSLEVSK